MLSSTVSQQGQELTDSTACSVDVQVTLRSLNNTGLKSTLTLYSCSLAAPPDHVDDPRVVEVCKFEADLSSVAHENSEVIKSTASSGRHPLYKIVYTINISFVPSAGLLKGTLTAYGKEFGNVDMQY
jgi:hypothetical protein